jgi:hypothetical protein
MPMASSSKTRDPWQQQNRLRFNTTMSRENINDMQVEKVNYLKKEKK